MRTFDEIKADYIDCRDNCKSGQDCLFMMSDCLKDGSIQSKHHEFLSAITDGIPTDRLEAICNAERENRCVVLPCKVGDMVYHIFGIQGIVESRARRIQVNRDGIFIVDKKGAWAENNIGKTVFITQAEAEQKLKEGKV